MLALIQAIVAIAYPLAIVWALSRFEPRIVAGMVLGLLALRGAVPILRRRGGGAGRLPWSLAVPVVAVAAVSAGTAIANDPLGLLLAPVFVNAALLASFGLSLRREPIVETLARLQVERLAPAEIRYCRRVTEIWCVFFGVNGAISFVLAWTRSLDAWALYTGFLSYCLMGLLFAGEYVYRHARFRRYEGGPFDRLLARWLPPGHAHELVRIEPDGADRARSILLEVPTGLACWRGHFPGRPMLPGVLQVDWVLREIERWRGERPRLVALEGLKFKQPVLPGDRLALELVEPDAVHPPDARRNETVTPALGSGETIDFCFRRAGEEVSRGRVRLGPERAATPAVVSGSRLESSGPEPSPAGRWPTPARLLVHADPMIWLRCVEAHDASETRCLVDVADVAEFAEPEGDVGAHVALEWMAQTVAAHAGLEREARGEAPSLGLLLGSKRVGFARPAYTRGERFRVVAVRGWGGEQGAASFDCRVESIDGRERVADARLSCFVPAEGGEQGATRPGRGEAMRTRSTSGDGR